MKFRIATLLGLALLAFQGRADAELLHAVTVDNRILTFHSSDPGTILNDVAIGGLAGGETVLDIDFRPATFEVFGVGNTGIIHRIDPMSGMGTGVANLSETLVGTAFGIDFNPTVDLLRIVSDANQNLRVVPDTGDATVDGMLGYLPGDANEGMNPNIVATSYTNSRPGATATMQFAIDANQNTLVRVVTPNDGTLMTVGSLGLAVSDLVGFDISGITGTAYAALTAPNASVSGLYTIDLGTGMATFIGEIGGGSVIRGITVNAIPEPSTVISMTIGLVGVAGMALRRRRRRS
jgi:hypothetical protein